MQYHPLLPVRGRGSSRVDVEPGAADETGHKEFPGSPVLSLPGLSASIPGRGTKLLQAVWNSYKKRGEKKQ